MSLSFTLKPILETTTLSLAPLESPLSTLMTCMATSTILGIKANHIIKSLLYKDSKLFHEGSYTQKYAERYINKTHISTWKCSISSFRMNLLSFGGIPHTSKIPGTK